MTVTDYICEPFHITLRLSNDENRSLLTSNSLGDGRHPTLRSQAARQPGQKMTVYDASVVDVQPTFPGGERAMLSYINRNRDRGIRVDEPQRVICGFVVMPDGQLTCISVLRGVDEAVNREAVRLIEEMPRWEAGRRHNRDVAVYCVVPIGFR